MYFTASLVALLRLATLGFANAAAPILRPREYDSREYYALELAPNAVPQALSSRLGLEFEGPVGELDNHYLFSGPLGERDVVAEYRRRRKNKRTMGLDDGDDDLILFSEKQKVKQLEKRTIPPRQGPGSFGGNKPDRNLLQELQELSDTLDIRDPIFQDQWHLFNTVDRGHDVNVTGLWLEGITGHNSTVAIVDDGLDMDSEDLKANYFAEGSYDFNDQVSDPRPRLSEDNHGTRCAGEIAAVKNNVCGVGVAWNAKVAGIRILSKQISDVDEAIALNYAYQQNQIYSCSWGPPDDGRSMEAPGILIKKAILKGVQKGRQGLGSIFVFASGNGAASGDNCNFDGYTNSIYSITVGAIDRKGNHPYYSEHCSAQMVVTYSSGSGDAIHTTDVGNQCYSSHGGTSAAAPLAAGIFALVISVRPDLNWRDLQYLSMDTAVPINEDDGAWEKTAIGKMYSHRYGYGKLDAYAIVQAAKDFKSVKPQSWFKSPVIAVNHEIPQGQKGLKSQITITKEQLKAANLARVEHVQIRMNASHGKRGDMSVDLISPKGIVSHIATQRDLDNSAHGYKNWDFMTVKHWGEDGVGSWSIIIKDMIENRYNGTLVDWSIALWGESIDADKAELHPLPGEEGMNKTHGSNPLSTTSSATIIQTTSLPSTVTTDVAQATGEPSDHITRPVNYKPTGEGSGGSKIEPTHTGVPSASSVSSEDQNESDGKAAFLPSFLPTFGVSAKTQAWIYGSFVVIAVFITTVAIYLFKQRRKQKTREEGMNYEFEALDNDDLEEGKPANQGQTGATGGRRRARDLYAAFGASDDEFSDDDDDDDDHDRDYYDDDAARGLDEDTGERNGDREQLLGHGDR